MKFIVTKLNIREINTQLWELLASKRVEDFKLYNSPYVHWDNEREEVLQIFEKNGIDYFYISQEERDQLTLALKIFNKVCHTLGVENALKMVKQSKFDLI